MQKSAIFEISPLRAVFFRHFLGSFWKVGLKMGRKWVTRGGEKRKNRLKMGH